MIRKETQIFEEFEKEKGYDATTTSDCELTNWLVKKLIKAREEFNTLRLVDVSVSLPDANPHICPNCSWNCDCSEQPCGCCNEH